MSSEVNYQRTLVLSLFEKLKAKKLRLVTAESCTGGMIASAITSVAGASEVFDRGFVTYSNEAKNEMIGVPMELIKKHGAVSPEVAESMARGALKHAKAQVAIAVTGIAGPTGGTPEKPVGLVYIAVANGDKVKVTKNQITGDRVSIQRESLARALSLVLGWV